MRAVLLLVTACGRIGFDEAATPAKPLCDAHPTALYCNDFDSSDLKGAIGDAMFAPGASGNGIRFGAAPGEMPRLTVDLGRVITSGPLFLSARFLLADGAPVADFVVLAQLLTNAFTNKVSFDLVADDAAQIANAVVPSSIKTESDAVPRDRWSCFELSVVADRTGNGSLSLAIDDAIVLGGATTEPTVGPEGFGKAELGAFASTSNGAAIEIVFDDWVVDIVPIGCP